MSLPFHFDNRFTCLPSDFYTAMPPEGVSRHPFLIHANPAVAESLGLIPTYLNDAEWMAAHFSGNRSLPGGEPLAMAYSGHQFGHWAGQLGDGRALLLGQVRGSDGKLWDVQLKGGGQTPYSRFADGRAVLRSSIREYLCGEAMHALGIPTTRSLCLVGTGEPVVRETIEPGAIITRVARSHIRFGHFEHFYYAERADLVTQLADHVIEEYFPDLPTTDRYAEWFEKVVRRTAVMIAGWQAVGFAHGVMNTDNMSILGLTLDYGPFGFMEAYDPAFICNHSDTAGRYAFNQQPVVGLWNLHALAHTLQSLIPAERAGGILKRYGTFFHDRYSHLMRRKLGLPDGAESDALWMRLLDIMAATRVDYTRTFRALEEEGDLSALEREPRFAEWLTAYRSQRTASAGELRVVNPAFVLRNWVAESAIRAAEDRQDYTVIDEVFALAQSPFGDAAAQSHFTGDAPAEMAELCVSCSS